MDRLAGFLERRWWFVLLAWVALLVGAMPLAAKQTDHLTSGGFQVPGSQSQVVDENIARFDGAQREHMAVVLARREGATTQAVRDELDRAAAIATRLPNVAVSPRAVAAAGREAGSASITVLPLEVSGDFDAVANAAVDFRDELGPDTRGGVEPHLVGQQALWAGIAGSHEGGPR